MKNILLINSNVEDTLKVKLFAIYVTETVILVGFCHLIDE